MEAEGKVKQFCQSVFEFFSQPSKSLKASEASEVSIGVSKGSEAFELLALGV